ncbi:MAG: hypothetical protein K1X94_06030 [Sandaracinaceae bacterium]|nr:hypothetical protein [Sandaracinaceae bacterium]
MSHDDLDAPFSEPPPRASDLVETVGVKPLAPGRDAAATVAMRPPPPPPAARSAAWGEIEVTGTSPTLREKVEEIDPDAHAIAPPRPPTTAVSPSAEEGAPAPRPVESAPPRASARPGPIVPTPRAWGEVDLSGVSSGIGRPVTLDPTAKPPETGLDPSATVRDAAPPVHPPFTPAGREVVVGALPTLPEGHVYYCDVCREYVPPDRVLAMGTTEGRVALPVCPTCRRFVRAESSQKSRSLDAILLEAITWPISREMAPTLLGNSVIFYLLSSFWVLGIPIITLPMLAAALGVLATYAAAIVRSSARGEDQPPAPSEAISSWAILGAVLRHAAVFVVGGLPLGYAILSSAHGDWSPTERTVLVVLGIVFFCLYLPAGQIVVSSKETFAAAMNPYVPLRFAFRVGGNYFLACAILFGFAIAHLVCVGLAMVVSGVVFGPGLLASACVVPVVVLGVFIEARMLGLVVREHRFDLALV